MSVKIIRKNPEALKEAYDRIGHATGKVVKVGFPKGEGDPYSDGTAVAYVAACHVYGWGVEERDFFRWGRRELEKTTKTYLSAIAKEDDPKVVDALLDAAGLAAVENIKAAIIDLDRPENSPATIAKKGSSNPLIDTEHMVSNVFHVVGDK